MAEIKAYAPGIYARSEELVRSTRDLDRNRTTEAETEETRASDARGFLAAQREAGLDFLSDGLLNWQDIFRPFCESARGLKPGALTRYSNTNTFFRAPTATGESPKLAEPLGEPYFRFGELPEGAWVATLPSPHSMVELGVGGVESLEVAKSVLRTQIEYLESHGCAMVVLQETKLLADDSGVSRLGEALDALQSPLPVAVQLPFGDAGGVLRELVELDVAAVGVDFYSTDVSALPRPFPKTLLAGVIDARNSLLEEPGEVAEFCRGLAREVEGELHLVPNGDLQFVPQGIAREKVLRLGEAARILRTPKEEL